MKLIRIRLAPATAPIRASNSAARSRGTHAVSGRSPVGAACAGAASAANRTMVEAIRRMGFP